MESNTASPEIHNNVKQQIANYRQEIRHLGSRVRMYFNREECQESQDIVFGRTPQYIGRNVKAQHCALTSIHSTVLNVIFSHNGELGKHHHKDQCKIVFVIEGELYDFVNHITVKTHEVYEIPAGKEHGFRSDHAYTTMKFVPPLDPQERL